MIRQLIYISTSISVSPYPTMTQILPKATNNNKKFGITGILLFSGGTYLQVLEGPADAVKQTFDRISADERHKSVTILHDKDVEERVFPEWSMGWQQLNADDPMSEQIKRIRDEKDIERYENSSSRVIETLLHTFLTSFRT